MATARICESKLSRIARLAHFCYLIPYSATLTENGTPKKLVKIGANFDKEKRTLGEWKIVEAS